LTNTLEYRPIVGDRLDELDRVVCVCCGWSGKEFEPFGHALRRNAQCPDCGSLERHRLIYTYLRSETPVFSQSARVLHIAPEPALARLFRAAPNVEYVSTDLSDIHVTIRMDITDILFRDDVFDCVICNHVLEHVPDDRGAMLEIRRVLKPSGFAILQVPLYDAQQTFEDPGAESDEDRVRLYGQRDHVRKYGRDYPDRLREAGFDLTVEAYPPGFTKDEAFRYGFGTTNLHVCRKQGAGRLRQRPSEGKS
jgi:SAM-dependent methyltransferase